MKRYTTAQAISILSKPGREGWYAEAPDTYSSSREAKFQFPAERIIVLYNGQTSFMSIRHNRTDGIWDTSVFPIRNRSDWRIIKPKREKLRRIGTTEAPTALVKAIHDLEKTGDEYEIFARRVGK